MDADVEKHLVDQLQRIGKDRVECRMELNRLHATLSEWALPMLECAEREAADTDRRIAYSKAAMEVRDAIARVEALIARKLDDGR